MKNMYVFTAGLVTGLIGGLSVSLYYKKKYFNMAEKQIHEMELYYNRRDEYVRPIDEEGTPESAARNRKTNDEDDADIETLRSVRARLKEEGKLEPVNYAGMYNTRKEEVEDMDVNTDGTSSDPADSLYPTEEDEPEDYIEETPEEEADRYHQEHFNDAPYVATLEETLELPNWYDHSVLYYYSVDETVTDDNDIEIDEPGYLVSTCLVDSGFTSNNETWLYVVNPGLDTIYEIQKINSSFYDASDFEE